jgi:hypothetical protein
VSRRRLLPLGAAVAALLVLAGIASHGRPLSGGRGAGPSARFFDYVATTLLIFAVLMLGVVVWALFAEKRGGGGQPPRRQWHMLSSVMMLITSAFVAYLISRSSFAERLSKLQQQIATRQQTTQTGLPLPREPKTTRNPQLRWDEVAIVAALLAGTVVVLLATRQTRRTPRRLRGGREEAISLALDESLDDLRGDPDLRRAIIAAYARMERALARAGLPRHPAEAPFEYVERALQDLDTSAESVRRLTALFEWAKFSQHEPEPEMRDEAVDALVAVRDELRGAVPA